MTTFIKKMFAVMLALALTIGCAELSTTTVEAKSKGYWLTGSGAAAGGNASLKYNGNGKFKMKGKWGKGASLQKSANAYFRGKKKKYKKTFKGASKVKSGSLTESGIIYDQYDSIYPGQLVGITIHVHINKKGKIDKIVGSAM
ncbi:MAG: hypothetical protein K6G64_05670 [Eubacterium sp.]|nr:hypothetical protein [Eubacterium sp.]